MMIWPESPAMPGTGLLRMQMVRITLPTARFIAAGT
jgi:hypothetical protein